MPKLVTNRYSKIYIQQCPRKTIGTADRNVEAPGGILSKPNKYNLLFTNEPREKIRQNCQGMPGFQAILTA